MFKVYLSIAAALVVWANAFIAIEIALRELSPIELILLRFTPLAFAFAAYLLFQARSRMLQILRLHCGRLLLISFFNIPVYNYLVFEGQKRVSPSLAALIVGCSPIFTYLFSVLLKQETWRARKALGMGAAFTGLYLAVVHGGRGPLASSDLLHAAMVMGASIATSFATVNAKIFLMEHSLPEMMLLMIPIGALPLLAFAEKSLLLKIPDLSALVWASVAFLSLASTLLGYLTWFYALKRMPASSLVVFINALPFLTMVCSYLLLGQAVTVWLVGGGILIAAGILITVKA